MFGSVTGATASSQTDWGEQLINQAATQSIRSLFTSSESVEVAVRCYPSSKLLQGSIDSFKMSGKRLLIRRRFMVETMSFETDAVAIDFRSILGGQIRLKQPTQAIAQVVLSEEGINKAFEADLVKKRLVNLEHSALTELSGGKPVSFTNVQVELLQENMLRLRAQADLGDRGEVPVQMVTKLGIERRRRICFQDTQFEAEGIPEQHQETSQQLTHVLADILNNMVDLDRFDLDGVVMRLNRLETSGKELIFSGYAQIHHFPRHS
jgi:hypothetical protein